MGASTKIAQHRADTRVLAKSLKKNEVYRWLLTHGYFPENYVLPPCFFVTKYPAHPKTYHSVTSKGAYVPTRTEYVQVQFPKTELTDKTFGIIDPEIHNDIAYHITRHWKTIVNAIFPKDSIVTSYSFPVPIDRRRPGRLGFLRAGRLIYEFIEMTDDDLTAVAYQYTHLVKADIKNFYNSIYTHSIAWAIHGKKHIRKPTNLRNFALVGNKLDKLFQNANDGCTNGIPIGPVVSDLAAELIASAVDVKLSRALVSNHIECEAVRFKDDYRILTKSAGDARRAIKLLQESLKDYNLELSDDKTKVLSLPDGLFREWVSKYHAVHPYKRKKFTWKQFRELYIAVVDIDRTCPSTGVIDRFLADITTRSGRLKVSVTLNNMEKVISMLIMLGNLRIKAFPRIIAVLESLVTSFFGRQHEDLIVSHLESYVESLAQEEKRNRYLISWITYFLVSNNLYGKLAKKPKLKDPITRSIVNNRAVIFKSKADFTLFSGCRVSRKRVSLFEHLELFKPPKTT